MHSARAEDLTPEQAKDCLEAVVRGDSVPQDLLAEVLRQVQFFLESANVTAALKARLQQLELAVLDTYRPQNNAPERLLITFSSPEGVLVSWALRGTEALLELMTEVAKVMDLVFTPAYDLSSLPSGDLSVEVRAEHLNYYQPRIDNPQSTPPTYGLLIERVGELFQELAQGDPATKEALQHLLSVRAKRAMNQLVRLLRPEEETALATLTLTRSQGQRGVVCAVLNATNCVFFYFPEHPEWQELTFEGVLIRREQDLDERKNTVQILDRAGVIYTCKKFQDRTLQDHLSHLALGAKIRLAGRVRFTYDDTLRPRRAECRVQFVLDPPLEIQQIPLAWE